MPSAARKTSPDASRSCGKFTRSATTRRHGLARGLLETATGYAKERGLQPVLDVVADSHAAIALYERSGWKLVGTQTAMWTTSAGLSPTLRCYIGP